MSRIDSDRNGRSAATQREAADWLARKDAGLEPAEELEFKRWLAGPPERAAAWRALQGTWDAFTTPQRQGRGESVLRLTEMAERRLQRQRRQRLGRISLGLAATLVMAFIVRFADFRQPNAEPAESTVRVMADRQVLPDDSAVELAEGAEIRIEFTKELRAVRVLRGEALFTVRKDAARPFVVSAGGVDVRAVGTEFSVRLGPEKVTVLVTEGEVAVGATNTSERSTNAASPPTSAMLVTAGSVVEVAASATGVPSLRSVSDDELRRELGWRDRRVEFTATPLAEAVAWVNRFNARQIAIDPSVAELRITGVFWSDDPGGFARLLEVSLGLRVIEETDVIRLAPRR